MFISENLLKDKAFLENSNILKKSFEYMVLQICKKNSEHRKIETIKEFNFKNDISIIKLFLYPFFIATSNGHSKSLFDLFGSFKATELGPISVEVARQILLNPDFASEYFDIKAENIEIKSNGKFEELIERFKSSSQITNINGEIEEFINLSIFNDKGIEKKLISAIDSGIETLNKQSLGSFFTFSENGLRRNSNKYRAFTSKIDQPHGENNLEYSHIADDKNRLPYYSNLEHTL